MFASRKLLAVAKNYSMTEGEALAILFALKRYEPIIQAQKAKVCTYHRSLVYVGAGSESNRKLAT